MQRRGGGRQGRGSVTTTGRKPFPWYVVAGTFTAPRLALALLLLPPHGQSGALFPAHAATQSDTAPVAFFAPVHVYHCASAWY
ncbi:hypothetical protein E2562_002568 [Oryza meyeriana var. granulata]|uniref:Uncharacterized protein n=1 Tax=Oryza meyeriana var. granulata TaxID=110450 RepID=A0A6G1F303_9ORYZ|nr:hypothetical protein E2562_002568 [Oryza meyeriana var. granulata]